MISGILISCVCARVFFLGLGFCFCFIVYLACQPGTLVASSRWSIQCHTHSSHQVFLVQKTSRELSPFFCFLFLVSVCLLSKTRTLVCETSKEK